MLLMPQEWSLKQKSDLTLQEYIILNGHHPEAYYKCDKEPIDDYEFSESEYDEESDSDEEMVDSDGEPYSEHDDIGDKRFMTI